MTKGDQIIAILKKDPRAARPSPRALELRDERGD